MVTINSDGIPLIDTYFPGMSRPKHHPLLTCDILLFEYSNPFHIENLLGIVESIIRVDEMIMHVKGFSLA